MLHLTELQTGLLLLGSVCAFTLATWALFVIIPNRNETIRFLNDRNQTLQYWVENMNASTIQQLAGSTLERKKAQLLMVHAALNEQLRKCLIDIEHCNIAIEKEKKISNEPQ